MFETNKKMEEYIIKDLNRTFFPDENVYLFKMYDIKKEEYIVDVDNKTDEDTEKNRDWSEKKILDLISKHIAKENVLEYSENYILNQNEDGFMSTYEITIKTTDHKFYIEAY